MRVLVADDSLSMRDAIAAALRERGDLVVTAGDGEEAWHHFQAEPFDAVITDWRMPRLDGVSLAARIRAVSPVPITIETSDPDGAEDAAAGLSNVRVVDFTILLRELTEPS